MHEADPELSATLETCERAVAAFIAAVEEWPDIAAVEEWPEKVTMSTMLQQRARLSLAKAAVLEAMKALLLNISEELRDNWIIEKGSSDG